MEAEKSHNLLSASWRNREAIGIIQSKNKGPRTRSAYVQGLHKMDVPSQAKRDVKVMSSSFNKIISP